jgi:hypothetical protein
MYHAEETEYRTEETQTNEKELKQTNKPRRSHHLPATTTTNNNNGKAYGPSPAHPTTTIDTKTNVPRNPYTHTSMMFDQRQEIRANNATPPPNTDSYADRETRHTLHQQTHPHCHSGTTEGNGSWAHRTTTIDTRTTLPCAPHIDARYEQRHTHTKGHATDEG